MQAKAKNNSLTKKVLFSIVAAGMLSGFVVNAEAEESGVLPYIDGEKNYNETSVNAAGVWVKNNRQVTLEGGTLYGSKQSAYHVDPNKYPNEAVQEAVTAALVSDSDSKLTANNVDFTGEIAASNSASISITGGSINAGSYEYKHGMHDGSNPEDNATNVLAYDNGRIELQKVTVNSNISAYSAGKIKVGDSKINAAKKLYANGENSVIDISFTNANKDENTVNVGEKILAEAGGTININNATIKVNASYNTDRIKATGAGSVLELQNSKITALNLVAEAGGKLILGENSSAEVDYIEAAKNVEGADGGVLEINGNLKANIMYASGGGKIYFKGGANSVYEVNNSFTINSGTVYVYGGTLKSDKLKDLINAAPKSIILDEAGVISTISNNIYANEASATQKDAGNIKNKGIEFAGGELILNDAQYTQGYAQTAQAELRKQGNTKLIMAGKLVEEGDVENTKPVGEIASDDNKDITFDQVTATTEGNLLIGGDASNKNKSIDTINVQDTVKNGFSVGALDLKAGSSGVIITNGKAVTLGGSKGGSIITVGGQEKEVKVILGPENPVDGVADGDNFGNLYIGNSLATADTKYKLNGEVIVNLDSNLNIRGQLEITKGLTLDTGTVIVNVGSLKTKELNIIGGSSNNSIKGTALLLGQVDAEKLSIENGDTKLLVGNKDHAGRLTVDEAELNDGTILLDPVWKDGTVISDASGMAVIKSTTVDGDYIVGRNSVLAFGADLQAAEEKFAKTGETWGPDAISAAAYIASAINIDPTKGSLTVNGALYDDVSVTPATPTPGSVIFADNSLVMVDAATAKAGPIISGVAHATTTIHPAAKLFIDEAKAGETYHILRGLSGAENGWNEKEVGTNNSLLKFTRANILDEYAVAASVQSVKEAFKGQVIAPNAYDKTVQDRAEGDADYDFILAAANSKVNGAKAVQVSALNSAAALSELAGVEHGTYAASSLLTDAVSEHMSLANAKEHDSDIWAKYIHTKEDVDGLAIANFGADYDAQYNGIVVGADLYKNGKATVGAALTYVDGNINGSTLAARTKNDATYYGASIYGGIQNEDSAVIGDISYLHGKNDITQYNSGYSLTADAKSDAFSIGVRAEKSVKAGVGKFVPYAGLRYMHLGTGNYSNSIGMSYDGDDMNLWLLPVGVKYSADVKTGSWTIRPIAEVGYVWNMGDRDATQTVSLNGASDGFGYDVTDSGSYIGRFMIEAEKANVTYGLGYEYQKGDSVKANRWMANLNCSF